MKTTSKIDIYYENVEVNIATGTTNYDVAANNPGVWGKYFGVGDNFPAADYATSVEIRTNQTISVILNDTAKFASVTIQSTDSPYKIEGVRIKNMFITNSSGSTAAVKIFVQPVKY